MTATTTEPTARPDASEMVAIHNVFRRLFGDLPDLVRAVADGDTGRAGALSAHVIQLTTGLHHHHTTEDEMLWPLLLDRVQMQRSLVLRAEEQHERVYELLELVNSHVAAFRERAAAADRDALAESLTDLDAAVREHMADEERYILPLVEQYLTVAEWAAVGEERAEVEDR